MTATTSTQLGGRLDGGRHGGPVELARYSTPTSGERVLEGFRTRDGEAVVIDVPADPAGEGRVYLVERHVEVDGNCALRALLDDYLRQSERLGDCPMAACWAERLTG
jgi:hypothetical protein